MIKDEKLAEFSFSERNKRPPLDPINAILSLGYSMLAKELAGVCHTVGLDPFFGFYHRPRYGRPSLALDLTARPVAATKFEILISKYNLNLAILECYSSNLREKQIHRRGRRGRGEKRLVRENNYK